MAAALARRLCGPAVLRAAWAGTLSLPVNRSDCRYVNLARALQTSCYISTPRTVTIQQSRQNSFFNTLRADELWKGAVGDTGPGARKGRGKRVKKRKRKNLNAGQMIGEETYEDFDSRVIEVKPVSNMTAKEGRRRSFSALVAIGNGNGAAGFALGKATDKLVALRKARNRAVHYLHYIERYQNHTIYHDITTTFKKTTIQMKKQNKGYGLRCHRAIITMCKLIGITDMYAKLSGSNNLLNLTKAFFNGLAQQETHQDLADKKSLYVVEFREECGALPIVVASPRGSIRKEPEATEEVPDTKLEWSDVRAAQGMKHSIWANVKRTVS